MERLLLATTCLIALLGVVRAKDSTCNGLKSCNCLVVNGSISGCMRNSEVVYLHDLKQEHGYPVFGIAQDAFVRMGRAKEVHLTSNDLLHVHPRAFEYLVNVRYLFLSDNFLANLAEGTFKKLPNLEYLSLTGNPNAQCPSFMPPCHLQNITKFPCCTEQVGNVERFEKSKKEWEEERLKYEEAMKANATDSNSSNSTEEQNDTKKDSSWFGW